MREEHYWYWINNIKGIGRKTVRDMITYFGAPEEAYKASERSMENFLKRSVMVDAWRQSRNEAIITGSFERMRQNRIRFLYPLSPDYPEQYRNIPDAPMGLYLKGKLPEKGQKSVAVIGARECTRYGQEMAAFFGRELAKSQVAVISGLARGVDGMAHRGAIEGKGYTLGVIAGGLDRVYPLENYGLFLEMEQCGGILSESSIGTAPAAGLFPQRNRLIAGLCDGILVVEAKEKSGTFITVDQGLEQGKEIFAIPGRISDAKSVGCNNLIKLGAHVVTEVQDVLDILHVEAKEGKNNNYFELQNERIVKMSLAPLEKMVYSCLRIDSKYIDEIIEDLQAAPQEVCMALNRLVLDGLVDETACNYYAVKL